MSPGDNSFPSLSCNCSLQFLNCRVWSVTCSTTAGASHCREVAVADWARLGSSHAQNQRNVQGSFPPNQPHLQVPKQYERIAHTDHGSHNFRKAFLHGAEGFCHKPLRVSLRWPKLLSQPMISSSQLSSLFVTSPGQWGTSCVEEG